jgi:hypothetical protein
MQVLQASEIADSGLVGPGTALLNLSEPFPSVLQTTVERPFDASYGLLPNLSI